MTKVQAKKVLLDAGASDADKLEARRTLGLKEDGSEDTKDTSAQTDVTQAAKPGDPLSQTGGGNMADASSMSTETLPAGDASRDSFPNTGESADLNKPSDVDTGAAAGAATAANRERFAFTPRDIQPMPPHIQRSSLTGEVDSATTQVSQPETAVSEAAHPTQRYSDSRGYSNFRRVAAPIPAPTVMVPVSDEVHYVDESGVVIGSVPRERAGEKGRGDTLVMGAKEFIVVSDLMGANGNTIAVRQNLPQPI